MKNLEFPIFKTKSDDSSQKFDLTDSEQRKEYFEQKAGKEIKKIREYLKDRTFIVYLLGKKNSGKGTYAKMFREIIDPENIEHFSIGDMIRDLDEIAKDPERKEEMYAFLKENYRGYMSLEEIINSLENRSTKNLLSSELILALVKREIAKRGRKALFIDGFPRGLDQISYSLFFRDLINYRDDPDFFGLIDVPESVIDERIKYRVICPSCQTSRNLKLLPTKKVGRSEEGDFYLMCDNPNCKDVKMVTKEGDELGIENIRDRIETDEKLMKKAFSLHGIPKILLRNSVPVKEAKEMVDNYELTPEYVYHYNNGKIEVEEKSWQAKDDNGILSYSLMPPPVVVSLIKQLADVLNLN